MSRSKDLQVATWLFESWIHLYGFAGAQVGLELLLKLSQEFWDSVFPLNEEDDLEARVAPFDWLDEKLSIKLKLAPVLREGRDGISYQYSDWELASRNENLIRKGSLKIEDGDESHLTQNMFLANCKWAPQGFFPKEQEVLIGTLANLEALGQFLDEKCGKGSPSLRHFRSTLESILRLVEDIIKFRGETAISTQKVKKDAPMDDEDKVEKNTQEVLKKTYQGKISSREEAYQTLQEIAEYLEAIEPHSPTPYLIRRAAIWGGMSFAQLLAELVRDPGDLRVIYDFLGLEPSSGNEEYEKME
jgi:type VI secretion system ImpA family protein